MAPTPVKLPQYRSHKVVSAAQITAINDASLPDILVLTLDVPRPEHISPSNVAQVVIDAPVFARYKPEIGDYYVRYEDGYQSLSPRKAFEEGYTRVDAPQQAYADRLSGGGGGHSGQRARIICTVPPGYSGQTTITPGGAGGSSTPLPDAAPGTAHTPQYGTAGSRAPHDITDRFYLFGGFCDNGLGANGSLGFFATFKDAQEFLRMKKRAEGSAFDLSWVQIANAAMQVVWRVDADDDTDDRREFLFDEVK